MKKKKEEKKFDFSAFQNYSSDSITEWFKDIPEDWKADAAAFIACQAIIWGARDTFQGVGIAEIVKSEYIRLCEQQDLEESIEFQSGLN